MHIQDNFSYLLYDIYYRTMNMFQMFAAFCPEPSTNQMQSPIHCPLQGMGMSTRTNGALTTAVIENRSTLVLGKVDVHQLHF